MTEQESLFQTISDAAAFLKLDFSSEEMAQAAVNNHIHLINSLIKPSCLIIDELGHCDFDRDSTRLFFDIVDRRYSRDTPNSMIITSNIDPSSWPQFFDEDSAVKCMMDRFFDHALMISFSGQGYRGRDNHRIKVVAGSQSGRPVKFETK